MDFDTTVKLEIYRAIAETARMPTSFEVAAALSTGVEEVDEAFRSLHGKRLLVPEPGDPSRIRMAPPFSGVPTTFLVEAEGKRYYANCVWDALGVPAALGKDAVIAAEDAATGEPMTLEVRGGRPVPLECVAHFAVPAAHWWDDIVYT
jgi:hypothetical protein